MPPWGKGPVQGKIHSGPDYIRNEFPLTDAFEKCSVERVYREDASKTEERELTDMHVNQLRSINMVGLDAIKSNLKQATDAQVNMAVGGLIVLLLVCGVSLVRRGNRRVSDKDM
jgi:hypothetical protein